jgi:hypothetical protein
VIAAGSRHHAGRRRFAQQQIGERAAGLERAGMLQHFKLEGHLPRRQAEVGHIRLDQRRSPDKAPDCGLGYGNAFARDRGELSHGRLNTP